MSLNLSDKLKLLIVFMRSRTKILNLTDSIKILQKYKIPLANFSIAKNTDQAVKIANKLKYPIALKVVSKEVIHKTDVGGIQLNIKSNEELQKAFEQILRNVKKKYPKAKIDGILIQKMITGGQEIIIGGKNDEQFGKVIMFGLGGIFTEVFDDVSFRIVPINKSDAENMIEEIKGYRILKGYRGKAYDKRSLIEILSKVSKLLYENPRIREMDINPVIVSTSGAVAVDSRIILI